jgi:hypothetical protein
MRLRKNKHLLWIAGSVLAITVAAAAAGMMSRDQALTVPAGTDIQVRLQHSIASNRSHSGESFQAAVARPVVIDGKTVIPKDAPVNGRIEYAHKSGRLSGVARLRLSLETVEVGGEEYALQTSMVSRQGGNHKKRNWAFIGGGGGGGALIGAIAAGGKGALIGGPIGAGAGIAIAALTGKKDFVLPAETQLTFRLQEPVNVHLKG